MTTRAVWRSQTDEDKHMTTNPADVIVIIILAVSLYAAFFYICREKKKGRHCIGCPMAGDCTGAQMCSKKPEKPGDKQ